MFLFRIKDSPIFASKRQPESCREQSKLTNFHFSINIEKNGTATEVFVAQKKSLVDVGESCYELVLVSEALSWLKVLLPACRSQQSEMVERGLLICL